MCKTLIQIVFLSITLSLYSQEHPDLGLNGTVTWIDDTHIRVEYDWSHTSQLLDWIATTGSSLANDNGTVTISNGSVPVRAMIWTQSIKCSKIIAEDVVALTNEGHHLNFYANLSTFTGENYLPDPGLGAVLATYKNFWVHNGTEAGNIGTPYIVVGVPRDYEFTMSSMGMTIKSSVDNVVYSYNNPCTPALDRKIALGGWGGNTQWGRITIEGEIILPDQEEQIPSDVINIQSFGSVFAPVIEVTGTPVIEWVFDDATTSSSATPEKNYGSTGSRRNFLRVTPWSALTGINVGYDAADGGYGDFAIVSNQYVQKFDNLSLVKDNLEYLCASYSPLTELDLRGFSAIQFVELFRCRSLYKLSLDSHPVLERLCVEDCDLDDLDLSGCSGLEDLRGAQNSYTSINWGSIGQSLWHICIRDNPQMTINVPDLTQFPTLKELLTWNTNQTGALVCNNPSIKEISSHNNHYTSADLNGCTGLRILSLSGSQLASINLGTASNLLYVKLDDCGLIQSQVDYVLETLDVAGRSSGKLDLTSNTEPSIDGLYHLTNLVKKGWIVEIMTATENIQDNSGLMKIIQTQDELKILLKDSFINWQAGLYSLTGNRIISKPVDSNELIFNVSGLAAGIYVVELSDGRQRVVKKVVL